MTPLIIMQTLSSKGSEIHIHLEGQRLFGPPTTFNGLSNNHGGNGPTYITVEKQLTTRFCILELTNKKTDKKERVSK